MMTLMPALAALRDRCGHFRSRRIVESDQAGEDQFLLRRRPARNRPADRDRRTPEPGARDRPCRLPRQRTSRDPVELSAAPGRRRLRSSAARGSSSSGAPLHEQHGAGAVAVHRDEPLAIGIERDLVDASGRSVAGERRVARAGPAPSPSDRRSRSARPSASPAALRSWQ